MRVGCGVPGRIGVAEANRRPGGVAKMTGGGSPVGADRAGGPGAGVRVGSGVEVGAPKASGVGEAAGLDVAMDVCIKVEHIRLR